MIRIVLTITLAFVAGRMASAAETLSASKSDLFYQATDNEVIFTPSVEIGSESGDLVGNQDKVEDAGSTLKMKFERGITENMSASLELGYRNGTLLSPDQFSVENKGLKDIQIKLIGNKALKKPSATLHYGAFINHSLKREKETVVDFNMGSPVPLTSDPHSAGSSLTPYIGYSETVGPYILGARVLQTVAGTKRDKVLYLENVPVPFQGAYPRVNKSVEKGGGASELKVFAERNFDRLTMNVATKFRHLSPKREIEPIEKTVQDELDMLSLEISPSYRIDANADLIGGISYTKLLNQNVIYNDSLVETGEILNVTLGGRFRF